MTARHKPTPSPDDDDDELDPMLAEFIIALAKDHVAEEMLIARRAKERDDEAVETGKAA